MAISDLEYQINQFTDVIENDFDCNTEEARDILASALSINSKRIFTAIDGMRDSDD